MPTIQEILTQDAAYSENSGACVEITSIYGIVLIKDTTGEQEDILLQGDDASAFISEVNLYWNQTGDMDKGTIALALAKPYIESIWN